MSTAPVEPVTEQLEPQAEPVPAAPRRVEWGSVPRVNLLPPEILEGRRFRRTQATLGLAVLGTLAAAGAATWWVAGTVSDARTELSDTQARVATLQATQAQYAEVPRVIAEVDAATAARAQAMSSDVTWYRYLGELSSALPDGVRFTRLSATMNTAGTAAASASANPLSPAAVVGTLAVDGSAPTYASVSDWLEALDTIRGIDAPALSSAAAGSTGTGASTGTTVTFSSSAVVTEAALSKSVDEGTDG